MNYLFYNTGSFISARLLATLLGLKATSNPNKIKDGKISIRYGNSYGNFDQDTNINSSEAIKLCSDSVKFGQWCLENGFNSPLYKAIDTVEYFEFPFLLRNKYHKQGSDIKFINSAEDFAKEHVENSLVNRYYVPFIEADTELGIHLVNGKVIKIFKKVLNQESNTFVKNQKSCHFQVINDIENNFKVAQTLCENLFNKLGLNFGRVDIAYNSDTKKYIIWEVNTAPGLNKQTAELYAKVLREIIDVS